MASWVAWSANSWRCINSIEQGVIYVFASGDGQVPRLMLSDAVGAPNCAGVSAPSIAARPNGRCPCDRGTSAARQFGEEIPDRDGRIQIFACERHGVPAVLHGIQHDHGGAVFTQVMLSTEVLPPLCGSFASSGMAVTPNSFAQYFAVSSLESTLPSLAPPKFTMPPR